MAEEREKEGNARPLVLIFRAPLFNASETFVRDHGAALRRYRVLFVGLEAKESAGCAGPLLLPAGRSESLAFRLAGRVRAMAERLRPLRPALVHAHFATDGLMALPLAEALGVPLVTTLHGHEITRSRGALLRSGRPSGIRYALFQRRLIERGTFFLAVSDAIRERALAQGFPAQRTITHHSGVDLDRFAGGGRPEAELVLHVGRLVEKKGTALLLDAFERVRRKRPDARLIVIGDGPLRSRLEKKAGPGVEFLGALPAGETAEWMKRAWLLAAPSVTARDGDSEGLPTVVCEAAAASLPVVASRHSGIVEAVVDGETGWLVPEGDTAALAERIEALLGDPERRAAMARAARSLAERRFDLARRTTALELHYDRLTGRA